ncbi:SAM-dependent methyltransferase [Campylobacter sp. MIT 12-5580]|uniref:class I SAM-dependent methyltransferase n=1 Tax=Campylobacter sp. MIT 12-5580 TaxID=2040651 RepID=UPI0010FA52FD|nr:class I SAM-dependent methyltransferase [Campylobacter sp. MIT 12-5580]TKX30195.1 SAM-dependent methyltransferase [Campylobacter sp. MIT 12-5580]
MAKQIWEDIFSSREWGKYPPENLIRFIARNFYKVKDRNKVKILELGLGTGANLWFCAREGFRVSGIEWSKSGIERFQKRMQEEHLIGQIDTLLQGDYAQKLDELEDESFDAIIDVASLTCNDFDKTRLIFSKLIKKLKTKGKFYSSTLAKGLLGYDKTKPAFQEPKEGIYTHVGSLRFEDKNSLKRLYKDKNFKIENILTSILEQDKTIIDKLYIVEGVKC